MYQEDTKRQKMKLFLIIGVYSLIVLVRCFNEEIDSLTTTSPINMPPNTSFIENTTPTSTMTTDTPQTQSPTSTERITASNTSTIDEITTMNEISTTYTQRLETPHKTPTK